MEDNPIESEVRENGSYPIEIILDNREIALKKEFDELNVDYKLEQLAAGDIVYRQNNKVIFICERKTVPDLYSSITSTRYREQRERLKDSGIKFCYIIENYSVESVKRTTSGKRNVQNLLDGAFQRMVLYHNIFILPTLSVFHTANTLTNIKKRLQEVSMEHASSSTTLVPVTRKSKLVDNLFAHQLALIPGLSLNSSAKISELYPSINSLRIAFEGKNSLKEKQLMLADIQVNTKKLGKVLSQRIYETVMT